MSPPAYSSSPRESRYDAVVIGAGPNGLAAAITLAREGHSVVVVEAAEVPGGGTRSAEVTISGFVHDLCSAFHPMGICSPFMRSVPLQEHGLEWVHAKYPMAHPLDGGRVAVMHRSLEETAAGLGEDAGAYRWQFGGLVRKAPELFDEVLGPAFKIPRRPLLLASFGLRAMQGALQQTRALFATEEAQSLFAGHAAHSVIPLDRPFSSAIAMMLTVAGHHAGWPVAKGGSMRIADAMANYLQSLGGEVVCNRKVVSMHHLPKADAYLFDTNPHIMARIAEDRLPEKYLKRLRKFRYGPGVFKMDYALSEPVPWTAAECRSAGTVHVGGGLEEIAASEKACWNGKHSEKPFVLVGQQSICDPTRAPGGKHTLWAYCHVPNGSTLDMRGAIEKQIERFAPGFRDIVLAARPMNTRDFRKYNANNKGGDVVGGANDWRQLLARPILSLNPYATPDPQIYLCSGSTPPGGGVHGMAGYHAAKAVLKRWKESGAGKSGH